MQKGAQELPGQDGFSLKTHLLFVDIGFAFNIEAIWYLLRTEVIVLSKMSSLFFAGVL